jgi:GTP-binding protein
MVKFAAQFETSAFALGQCPRWDRAEIALAGRSNVGKSSLLNALAGVKGLARTSSTPGRTQSLNFFVSGDGLALVDLPGYGYAKVPEKVARAVAEMMTDYLAERENLAALVLLVDSRRGPGHDEAAIAATVRGRGVEVIVAATKCDKLNRSQRAAAMLRMRALDAVPILCSAATGEGIDELRRRIVRVAAKPRADTSRLVHSR